LTGKSIDNKDAATVTVKYADPDGPRRARRQCKWGRRPCSEGG